MKFMLPTKSFLFGFTCVALLYSCNSIEKKEERAIGFSIPFMSPAREIFNSDSNNLIRVDVKKDSVYVYFGKEKYYHWDDRRYSLLYDHRLVYGRTDTGIIFIRKDKAILIEVPDTLIKTKPDFIFQPIK